MKIGSAPIQLRFGGRERRVPVAVFSDPDVLGQALAREILAQAEQKRSDGRTYVLGCPAGRSLRSTYLALAALAAAREADLSRLVVAMMDEYLVTTPQGPQLCPSDAHYSCRGYGRREILDPINGGLPPQRRIPQENLWYPEPQDAMAYEERLRATGGFDLFLAASGASDGHVAFNSVGTTLTERTRVIRLSTATRRDNLETFPDFGSLDELPEFGVGVGLGTIVEQSRQVVLVMTGKGKRAAESRPYTRGCSPRESLPPEFTTRGSTTVAREYHLRPLDERRRSLQTPFPHPACALVRGSFHSLEHRGDPLSSLTKG
jgi:glucosamine-6-phosphate deaminase